MCVFLGGGGGNILCKYITYARARCWERLKVRGRGARSSDLSIGVKCHQVSGVWTKEVFDLLPRFGASMQSLPDKTRERASAWLRGEGTKCKQREIFWARRAWYNSLRASFSCLLLPPCFFQAWMSVRESTRASTRQFERTDFPPFKVLTSARASFTAMGLSLMSSFQMSRVSKGGPEELSTMPLHA